MSNTDRLLAAATDGDLETVRSTLASGADVHAQGEYALWWSAHLGHVQVVRELLAHGADTHFGEEAALNAALNAATWNGHVEVVRVLLEHGANARDAQDVLLRSIRKGNVDMVRVLLEHGAQHTDALWTSVITRGRVEIVRLLLEHGIDVHADNDVALRFSADRGDVEVVRVLLDYGADASTVDTPRGIQTVETAVELNIREALYEHADVVGDDVMSIVYSMLYNVPLRERSSYAGGAGR